MRAKAVAKRLAVEKQIRETDKRGDRSFGAFANDPVFDEAMRLGREWREQANRGKETMQGWLAEIRRHTARPRDQVVASGRLADAVDALSDWTMLRWDDDAAELFLRLRRSGLRIGMQDLKIACITLAHDATLLPAALSPSQARAHRYLSAA
jgi:hypothetical protein